LPLRAVGEMGQRPGEAPKNLGAIRPRAGAMGPAKWHPASDRPFPLRPSLAHVLSAAALDRSPPCPDPTFEGRRHPRRLSLSAAPPFGIRPQVWRKRGRLPGHRGYQRTAPAPAILQRPLRVGPGARDRIPPTIPLRLG